MKIDVQWIDAEELEHGSADLILRDADGILVPGGFGSRGTEGKIKAVQYAREMNVPYLGLCFGMQLAVIETLETSATWMERAAQSLGPRLTPSSRFCLSRRRSGTWARR